jgi:hypothetical protein
VRRAGRVEDEGEEVRTNSAIPFANTLILLGWESGLLQAEGEEVQEERSSCSDKVSKLIISVLSLEIPYILKFVMICFVEVFLYLLVCCCGNLVFGVKFLLKFPVLRLRIEDSILHLQDESEEIVA